MLLKTLLEQIGLQGFLKTTGGKGLRVVIPIQPTVRWDVIKEFAKAIADLLVQMFPDRFTAKMSKATRAGKTFVDYLRNAEGATAIAPYPIRARATAPVATAIEWSELRKDVRFDYFTTRNVPTRLKRLKSDPMGGFALCMAIDQQANDEDGWLCKAVTTCPARRARRTFTKLGRTL